MKGFAVGLAMKQMRKATGKSPIGFDCAEMGSLTELGVIRTREKR